MRGPEKIIMKHTARTNLPARMMMHGRLLARMMMHGREGNIGRRKSTGQRTRYHDFTPTVCMSAIAASPRLNSSILPPPAHRDYSWRPWCSARRGVRSSSPSQSSPSTPPQFLCLTSCRLSLIPQSFWIVSTLEGGSPEAADASHRAPNGAFESPSASV